MTPAHLLALADQVEAEPASMDLWWSVFVDFLGIVKPPPMDGRRFSMLLDIGAYLDAADMLRPKGWLIDVSEWPAGSYDTFEARLVRESDYDAKHNIAETEVRATVKRGPHAEARARLAAALRAVAAGETNG